MASHVASTPRKAASKELPSRLAPNELPRAEPGDLCGLGLERIVSEGGDKLNTAGFPAGQAYANER